VVLYFHPGEDVSELGGDEGVKVGGGGLGEAVVVVPIVVEIPGSLAVELVVGDKEAVGLEDEVLDLPEDGLQPW